MLVKGGNPSEVVDDEVDTYDYPFPEDKDAEFRRKCQERFPKVLTLCWIIYFVFHQPSVFQKIIAK